MRTYIHTYIHTSYIHTYFIQPSLAQPLVRTGIVRCSRRSAEHQGAANHSCNKRAIEALTLRAETHRKLPLPTGTTKDPKQVRMTMPS